MSIVRKAERLSVIDVRETSSELLKRIQPVHSLPPVLTACVYGRSGTGKTSFAGTFPTPALLLDIQEKGTDSVSNVSGLETISLKTWEEFEEIYWYLKGGKHKFKTVILDQLGQLQNLGKKKVLRDRGMDEDTSDFGGGARKIWGSISSKMITWILHYRNLEEQGINVCFIAHDRSFEGDEDNDEGQIDPSVGPRVMPSVAEFLNGSVKVIGNTFIRERFVKIDGEAKRKKRLIEYGMRVGPHAVYIARIRAPRGTVVPDVIVDPSYDKVMAILKGNSVKPVRRKA